ncbi:MAG: FAD-dependent oxidoreductase [Syntrophobacteraceae bacterium]|jgi:NADPH-dependent glutamate synthase beta subunit-like oxidoreductase/coenzyme F420-reducing hydrogenase delta subunit
MMDKQSPQISERDLAATCSAACPVHTDTREYVQRLSRGDYEGALDVLLEVNPFPSVCGRICHHPCESECRRKEIDSAVSLRMLKRFLVENTREYRAVRRKRPAEKKEGSVAIIGSGPSGLTAGLDLALLGYRVRVYEKDSRLGGMLAHAIPRYRLPVEALAEDIEDILASGVEVRTDCEVGKDIAFDDLRKENDAILIAVGLSESHSLPIPGVDAQGVFPGIAFLWDIANGLTPELGDRVLVVGGGNVAIDIARAAKRLGPSKVYMACLEKREEMPAWKWEIEEAEQENIEVLNSWGPLEILEKKGKVTGIQFKRCVSVFDDQGRFSPRYDESLTKVVEIDSVILAIGQKADLGCLAQTPVAVQGGRLQCDRASMATSERGVFACGEVITGPGSAIGAIAMGHDAAKVISHFLETGETLKLDERTYPTIGELPAATAALAKRFERIEVALADPAERIKDFSPIEPGYSEAEALAESRRCLACATGAYLQSEVDCAGCLTCVRVCPFGVAQVERTAVMPAQQCQTCGLCAAECPAAGIALSRFATNGMKDTLKAILAKSNEAKIARPFLVSYCCLNETTGRLFLREQTEEEIQESGILRVMIPCVARLSTVDLLSPFELGADMVAVIACKENGCFYTGAEELLARRISRVKKFLNEIGVGQDGLQLFKTDGVAEESWPAIWKQLRSAAAGTLARGEGVQEGGSR